VQDSVAHSQMKGTFSTSSYSLAAFAIFSFASLNVESLRAIRSSLDCMPQLIHLRRQEKTFVPEGTTSPTLRGLNVAALDRALNRPCAVPWLVIGD